jgi:hypothetical protein
MRQVVSVKSRQQVRMPSGRPAVVLELGLAVVTFQYADGDMEVFEMSRAVVRRLFG